MHLKRWSGALFALSITACSAERRAPDAENAAPAAAPVEEAIEAPSCSIKRNVQIGPYGALVLQSTGQCIGDCAQPECSDPPPTPQVTCDLTVYPGRQDYCVCINHGEGGA